MASATPGGGVGSLASYTNLSQVGEGMYGYVYRAQDSRGEKVALKRMIIHKEHLGFPLCAVREIKFLKQLTHKNIVQLRDIVTSKGCEHLDLSIKADSKAKLEQSKSQDRVLDAARQEQQVNADKSKEKELEERVEEAVRQQREREYRSRVLSQCGSLYLVFEYVQHDLGGLVDAQYAFPPRALKSVARQIFEVLDYLAERHVIHRDIKCSNILISDQHRIKLADFGLARSAVLPDGREGLLDLTNNVVTMWYKAPELLLGSTRYSYAVDVWSAGCVLAELLLGRPFLPGRSALEQLELTFRALGTPSERDWPDVVDLPLYAKMFRNAPKFPAALREAMGSQVPEAALLLLERIFVMDAARRCSACAALSSRYFLSAPFAPDDPAELEPLCVEAGASLHEYESKQRRRSKKEEDRLQQGQGQEQGLGDSSKASRYTDATPVSHIPQPPQPPAAYHIPQPPAVSHIPQPPQPPAAYHIPQPPQPGGAYPHVSFGPAGGQGAGLSAHPHAPYVYAGYAGPATRDARYGDAGAKR